MKRKFLLLVMMCLFGGLSSLLAEETTIKIGNKSTTSQYFPARLRQSPVNANPNYNYSSICQQIYTADEIKNANNGTTPAGKISKIAFKSATTNITTLDKNVKVYMRNVDATTTTVDGSWDTSDELKNNKVYDGSVSIDGNGYLVFNLSPAFNYVEGKNILIFVDNNRGTSGVTIADVKFEVMATNSKQAAYTVSSTQTTNYGFDANNWPTCSGRTQKNVIEITFSSGGSTETPTAPTLNYPSNSQESVFNPFLRFTLGSNTTHYQIQMGTSQDNMTDLTGWVEKTTSEVDYQTSNLTYNHATTYYWKVIAKNEYDTISKASETRRFTTEKITSAPEKIVVVSPEDNATGLINPNLQWNFSTYTEDYQLLIDGEIKIDWTNRGYGINSASYQTSGLSTGEHTWQVNVRNSVDTTIGEEYTFSIASLPDNVTPVSPVDGATGVTSNVVRFQFAPNTTHYRLLYSDAKDATANDMGYISALQGGTGSTWTSTGGATEMEFVIPFFGLGKTLYWAVDVKNDAGKRAVYKTGNEADAKDVTIYSFTVSSTLPVTNTAPANGAANLDNPTLTWKYNGNATHYQVYFGTDANNLEAKDWMERTKEDVGGVEEYNANGSFTTSNLDENTTYFWRVDVKDANENVYKGETWSFTSKLPVPQNVTADPDQVKPTFSTFGATRISWNIMNGVQGYDVYLGTDKLNAEIIPANTNYYDIKANITSMILDYNMDPGHSIYVYAVYESGVSMSEAVIVKVTGTGLLDATVIEDINEDKVAGATITLTQIEDEFGNTENLDVKYTFTTNAYGDLSTESSSGEKVLNGTYTINVTKENYIFEGSEPVEITNNGTTEVKLVISPNIPGDVTPVTPVDEATNVTSKTIKFALAEGTEAYRFLYGETDKQVGEQGMQPMLYYINGKTDNKATWVETNGATEAEVEIPYITAGKTHYWAIEVKNAVGQRLFFGDQYVLYKDVAVYSFTANETLPVVNTAPANGATNLTNPTLTWEYKGNATRYMVRLGESENELYPYPNGDYQTRGEEETGSLATASLKERTKYYWRVDVLDANDNAYKGDVWSFVSTLPAPVAKANTTQIVPTLSGTYGETTISWVALEGVTGYNVYLGTEKLNAEILSAETTEYTIAANTLKLTHNMENGYDIYVEAVYELGNSMSKAVNVKVTGTGFLNAKIVKSFNKILGVDGATIKLTQLEDEFENVYENGAVTTFTTDENGNLNNERVFNGKYAVEVSRKYYETYKGTIEFKQGQETKLEVTLKAESEYVFEVSTNNNTFNSIHIYLENIEWGTAQSGNYNVYLKNGEEVTMLGNYYFAPTAAGNDDIISVYFIYEGWANLSKGSYQFGVAKAEDQINWSETVTRNYAVFENDGNWSDENNWTYNTLPGENDEIHVRAAATIAKDEVITAGKINIEDDGRLTINGSLTAEAIYNNANANAVCLNDGGQLRQGNADLSGVFNMNVTAPTEWDNTTNKDGWQFIASPFTDAKVEAWTTGSYYDFYKYDGTSQLEWINEKDTNNDFETVFVQGRGYLASHENENIKLSGTFNNATTYTWEGLTYNEANDPSDPESKDLANFYLLGNPFTFNMDMSAVKYESLVEGFAIVNAEGGYTYVGADQETTTIPVGDGFFVKVKEPNATDEISLSYGIRSSREKSANINLVATSKAGKDNVVINFAGQSEGFNKLQNFNDEIATVCVVENGKAYGIYNCESDVNEIEVMFSAKQMGSYSLSFDINGEFETVTLVDRMTGVETDMIEEGEYNFIATSNDMKNRFVVRLSNSMTATEEFLANFVYQSGEELIVNAEGTIQIIDMMGRVVYSAEHSNGSNRINVSEFNNAAYVVRVVNGNGVRSQKVVIY